MKVEIKEVKKERESGLYKVQYLGAIKVNTMARYTGKEWFVISISEPVPEQYIKVLDETPITFEETETKPEQFEPIELSLTIESKEELQELWHRLNISIKDINNIIVDDDFNKIQTKDLTYDFWKKLDKIIEERNIEL